MNSFCSVTCVGLKSLCPKRHSEVFQQGLPFIIRLRCRDNRDIHTMNGQLPRLVAAVAPGETVDVVILRNGKKQTVRITIDAQSEKEA